MVMQCFYYFQRNKLYSKYFVVLSKNSHADHKFLVFITRVLYQLHYLDIASQVVLVNVSSKFLKKMPINLSIYDRVNAVSEDGKLGEDHLNEIWSKLSGKGIESRDQ